MNEDAPIRGLRGAAGYFVSLRALRKVLADLGLHVVTAAEMAVLDACSQAEVCPGQPRVKDPFIDRGEWRIAKAELARRDAKK